METLTVVTASPAEARVIGPALPARADLDAATAATAAAIADPAASRMAVIRAAEAEQATLIAYSSRPGAAAELEAGI